MSPIESYLWRKSEAIVSECFVPPKADDAALEGFFFLTDPESIRAAAVKRAYAELTDPLYEKAERREVLPTRGMIGFVDGDPNATQIIVEQGGQVRHLIYGTVRNEARDLTLEAWVCPETGVYGYPFKPGLLNSDGSELGEGQARWWKLNEEGCPT